MRKVNDRRKNGWGGEEIIMIMKEIVVIMSLTVDTILFHTASLVFYRSPI